MAEGKKSFVLYADLIKTFEHLTDEQRGQVIMHILEYVNDSNPEPLEGLLAAVAEPIIQQLKRDLKKYERIKGKRSEAGKRSAEKRKQQNQQVLTSVEQKPTPFNKGSTNSTVNDTVTVTVNDTVNDNVTVNETNKDNIESRKLKFAESLKPYVDQYGREMLIEFRDYWTEHNDNGKKMRFEYAKNQPFNVSRRLATWSKRNQERPIQGKQTKKRGEGVNAEYLQELQQRLNPNT